MIILEAANEILKVSITLRPNSLCDEENNIPEQLLSFWFFGVLHNLMMLAVLYVFFQSTVSNHLLLFLVLKMRYILEWLGPYSTP